MEPGLTSVESVVLLCSLGARAEVAKCLEARAMHVSEGEARLEYVQAFVKEAGKARRDGDHHLVCRLTWAAYHYRPASLTRKRLRQMLVEAGAAGYLPKLPLEYSRRGRSRSGLVFG